MRPILLALLSLLCITASSQYYYKDILGTKESADLVQAYTRNKVSKVVLSSYNKDNEQDADFYVEQQFNAAQRSLKTISSASSSQVSALISYFDAEGRIIRTVDSSEVVATWTDYSYNNAGQLVSVKSNSSDSGHRANMAEQHLWQWNGNTPVRMLRIKNGRDTIFVDFKTDDKGLVIEEQETHRRQKNFPTFYYYNDRGLLSDIARYNGKVDKVIPDYMFEYSDRGQVIQKITVPANSGDYLIWRYQYGANGLKTKEAVYNKKKQLTGKIEYQYSFGS